MDESDYFRLLYVGCVFVAVDGGRNCLPAIWIPRRQTASGIHMAGQIVSYV